MPTNSEAAGNRIAAERALLRIVATELFKRARPEDRAALLSQLRSFPTEQFLATLGPEVGQATEAVAYEIEEMLISAALRAE